MALLCTHSQVLSVQHCVLALHAGDVGDVHPKSVMELLLMTQYFDTFKEIGTADRSSTLFLTHTPAAMRKVSQQLRKALQEGGPGDFVPSAGPSRPPLQAAGMAR